MQLDFCAAHSVFPNFIYSYKASAILKKNDLEVLKTQLDKALSNLVWPHSAPCSQQEVGLETS